MSLPIKVLGDSDYSFDSNESDNLIKLTYNDDLVKLAYATQSVRVNDGDTSREIKPPGKGKYRPERGKYRPGRGKGTERGRGRGKGRGTGRGKYRPGKGKRNNNKKLSGDERRTKRKAEREARGRGGSGSIGTSSKIPEKSGPFDFLKPKTPEQQERDAKKFKKDLKKIFTLQRE